MIAEDRSINGPAPKAERPEPEASSARCEEIEKALKKSQRQLAEAQKVGHIGSWEWDVESNSMTWSDEMFRIFGLTPRPLNPTLEEVLAHTHPDDRSLVEERLQRALLNLAEFSYESRIIRPDGTFRILQSRGEVIATGDSIPLRLICVEQDITESKYAENERKRLEEQLRHSQKMEAVGRLAGGIAHDFNNILTAILGYSELLQMKMAPDNPLLEMVEPILTSAQRASHLTQGLLTFSRKQVLDVKPADINGIISGVLSLLSRIIGEDIEIRASLCANPVVVLADPFQIEQVLMNLAANARDAMPRGGDILISTGIVRIDEQFIREHGWGQQGPHVLLSVADTGKGMDEATREKIFEPFFTSKEVGKGTGLGLAIVYGIIKQHNGVIQVQSSPLKGSVFEIYLPLIEKRACDKPAAPKQELSKGSGSILYAEDDGTLRKLMKAVLEEAGYSIIEAIDGQDAVQKCLAHSEEIPMAILDVIMPKKNGREVYEILRERYPDMKFVPQRLYRRYHRQGRH